jgi:hypothetical protein
MKKKQYAGWILGLIAALATGAALAEIEILEDAIQTTASAVVLPSAPPSSLVVTPCSGCKPLSVLTSVRAQYFIDKEPVELGELRTRLATRPDAPLVIIYDRNTRELRRLRAFLSHGVVAS